ncbi:MAG TPA: transcriptional regulator [Candidatus Dormibacteraeota bacterium]|nr:transcriptional regulator [Candidatus Dormibacteraeota bacterium]
MTSERIYEFGRFRLDANGQLLLREGQRVPLTPKAIEILITLVESRGNPVGRNELLQKVWADAIVEEGSLTSHISLLRKALGEGAGGQQFIETISKRGYRFVGSVKTVATPPAGSTAKKVMLIVLPFEILSGGKKHGYFSEGGWESAADGPDARGSIHVVGTCIFPRVQLVGCRQRVQSCD